MKTTITMSLLIIIIGLTGLTGWCLNIAELFKCDFKSPYKAEAIRTVGVFVAPIGSVAGFVDIED